LTDFSGFLYKTLVNIVGPENASDRDFELEAYTRDLSSAPEKRASFVVRPSTTEQVASILKIANRYKVPVYIRGGGTSHWGEWLPLQGGILMDMSGLNQIIEIDERNLTATVQGGCTWFKLRGELQKRSLSCEPREMGGRAITIGASITKIGSGSVGVTKRGRLGWDVLGLEVVLPTGEVIKTVPAEYLGFRPFENRGLGPNLTQFFIGSGGELGVITEVTLRVTPLPLDAYLYFDFENLEEVERVGDEVTRPVGDELAFHLDYYRGESIDRKAGVEVRVWVYGYTEEELDFRTRRLREICSSAGGIEGDAKKTEITHHRDHGFLWGGLTDYFDPGPIDYVGGYCPIYSLHKFYDVWNEIVPKKHKWTPAPKSGFGGWLIPRGWGLFSEFRYIDPEERQRVRLAAEELTQKWFELDFMPWRLGDHLFMTKHTIPRLGGWYELIKRLKRELDPNDILNPEKMIR
jgi:FAD/FMN-containing dehydrogenase